MGKALLIPRVGKALLNRPTSAQDGVKSYPNPLGRTGAPYQGKSEETPIQTKPELGPRSGRTTQSTTRSMWRCGATVSMPLPGLNTSDHSQMRHLAPFPRCFPSLHPFHPQPTSQRSSQHCSGYVRASMQVGVCIRAVLGTRWAVLSEPHGGCAVWYL